MLCGGAQEGSNERKRPSSNGPPHTSASPTIRPSSKSPTCLSIVVLLSLPTLLKVHQRVPREIESPAEVAFVSGPPPARVVSDRHDCKPQGKVLRHALTTLPPPEYNPPVLLAEPFGSCFELSQRIFGEPIQLFLRPIPFS